MYRRVDEERNAARAKNDDPKNNDPKSDDDGKTWAINYLTDSNELPRWLQGRPYYNVGHRNNLWMLQHAIVAANQLGENTEITLITLYDDKSEFYLGGIGHLVEQAKMAGIKVKKIPLSEWQAVGPSFQSSEPQTDSASAEPKPPGLPQPAVVKSTIGRNAAARPSANDTSR